MSLSQMARHQAEKIVFEIKLLISFANEVIDNLEQVSAVLRTLHRFSNYQVETSHNYMTLIVIMSRMRLYIHHRCVRFARMGRALASCLSMREVNNIGQNN